MLYHSLFVRNKQRLLLLCRLCFEKYLFFFSFLKLEIILKKIISILIDIWKLSAFVFNFFTSPLVWCEFIKTCLEWLQTKVLSMDTFWTHLDRAVLSFMQNWAFGKRHLQQLSKDLARSSPKSYVVALSTISKAEFYVHHLKVPFS